MSKVSRLILNFEVLGDLLVKKSKKNLLKIVGGILTVIVVFLIASRNTKCFERRSIDGGSRKNIEGSAPTRPIEAENGAMAPTEEAPKQMTESSGSNPDQESEPEQVAESSDNDPNQESEPEQVAHSSDSKQESGPRDSSDVEDRQD
jgi:hypothetical protein